MRKIQNNGYHVTRNKNFSEHWTFVMSELSRSAFDTHNASQRHSKQDLMTLGSKINADAVH